MRHVNEGNLRAFLDGALPVAAGEQTQSQVQQHLERCARCRARLSRIEARANYSVSLVTALLVRDEADSGDPVVSAQAARRRLAVYERTKEEDVRPMVNVRQVFTRRYRPAWVALVMVLALGVSLTFAPVRALAGNLLGLFRVQKIEVVEFNPSALFGEQGTEAAMRSLSQVMSEQVTVEVAGEAQEVDETTLRSLSSIRVRLPQEVEGEVAYGLQPGAHMSAQVDLPRIRALLAELGYEGVDLPDALDGAQIDVQLAGMAVAAYGDCAREPRMEGGPREAQGNCTVLMQMRSPVISAPDELDVQQLGQAYLQLLGMSADEAARFSSTIDWTATLVIPLPRSEAQYEEVRVDGVTGVLIRPTQQRLPQGDYALMWVANDVIYTLTGSGSSAEALQIANSLQ